MVSQDAGAVIGKAAPISRKAVARQSSSAVATSGERQMQEPVRQCLYSPATAFTATASTMLYATAVRVLHSLSYHEYEKRTFGGCRLAIFIQLPAQKILAMNQ